VDAETRTELQAIAAARKELGAEHEDHLIERSSRSRRS